MYTTEITGIPCISKSSAAIAAKLFKFCPYKMTVVRALQPRDPANGIQGQNLQNEPPYWRRGKENTWREILEVH
jgi:hypothetical protein